MYKFSSTALLLLMSASSAWADGANPDQPVVLLASEFLNFEFTTDRAPASPLIFQEGQRVTRIDPTKPQCTLTAPEGKTLFQRSGTRNFEAFGATDFRASRSSSGAEGTRDLRVKMSPSPGREGGKVEIMMDCHWPTRGQTTLGDIDAIFGLHAYRSGLDGRVTVRRGDRTAPPGASVSERDANAPSDAPGSPGGSTHGPSKTAH
jgi:hypothetical protein